MSNIFPRHTANLPPQVANGDGAYVVDANGKRYLDACGGAAVSCLGHSNQVVVDAVKQQLDKIAYAHTGFFTSEPAEQLAAALCARAPDSFGRVYFHNGGSEAIEASLKLARQYFVEIKQPQRVNVISRLQSYHGNTLGALAAGGNMWRREPFEPLLTNAIHHIEPCYYYRWAEEGETPASYGERMANQLEAKIKELGEDSVMAFIAEPVVGATLGAVTAEAGYFKRIRDICDRYDVLLILDEIMCGTGRTGSFFAFEQEGITPDIVTLAKGLGAGVQPISAMMCTNKVYAAFESGSGFFQHGHTYIAHPTVCAASLAVLQELDNHKHIDAVKDNGVTLLKMLQERFGNHPNVGDVRGRGYFLGIELVKDRQSKEPLDSSLKVNAKIKAAAFDAGLMVYPMGGTVDGATGDHILLAPPFILMPEQFDELVDKLATAIGAVLPS